MDIIENKEIRVILTPAQIFIFRCILKLSDSSDNCTFSLKSIADEENFCMATVKRTVEKLRDLELISYELKKEGRCKKYVVKINKRMLVDMLNDLSKMTIKEKKEYKATLKCLAKLPYKVHAPHILPFEQYKVPIYGMNITGVAGNIIP
ncbi:hypothetical protein EZS27_018241 [termite gut metagenome]|uniref:Uncharacterized protein n=1 Tax=termite gut metagenome TaxID=433724 RepID=A0A5J4RI52_9ZZZZ